MLLTLAATSAAVIPVSERNTPFAQVLALQSHSINRNPAPDLVLWKPMFQCVFFSGGVNFSQTPLWHPADASLCPGRLAGWLSTTVRWSSAKWRPLSLSLSLSISISLSLYISIYLSLYIHIYIYISESRPREGSDARRARLRARTSRA